MYELTGGGGAIGKGRDWHKAGRRTRRVLEK